AARKAAPARKPDAARGRATAHARKNPVAAKKPAAHPAPTPSEQQLEARKTAARPAVPPPAREPVRAASLVPAAPRAAAPGDGDDAEGAEPGSLLAGPRNVQP